MFEIRVAPDGNVIVSGQLSAAESPRALHVFRELSRPTTVDCAGLDYVSSAGIRVLLEAYKRLTDDGHTFSLVNVSPRVKLVLVYAGLDKLFGIT